MSHYSRELLLGSWFRQWTEKSQKLCSEEAFFHVDGSFEFTFSAYDSQGRLQDQITEFGDWGLVGDIHFTITKSEFTDEQHYAADMADKDNYQAYRVLQLSNQEFCYQHVVTGERYTLKRVNDAVGHC